MKKSIHILCLIVSYFILTSGSCKHDSNTSVNPSNTGTSATATPGAGWKVALFSERTENKTGHFSGYTFDFASNGTMTAVKSGQSVNGTWKQYQDDGITKFAISLATTDKDLSELNDDWALVSKSESFISLKDDNSEKNEQLQFSK